MSYSTKSSGPDGIPVTVFKHLSPELSRSLLNFPELWIRPWVQLSSWKKLRACHSLQVIAQSAQQLAKSLKRWSTKYSLIFLSLSMFCLACNTCLHHWTVELISRVLDRWGENRKLLWILLRRSTRYGIMVCSTSCALTASLVHFTNFSPPFSRIDGCLWS